MQVKESEFADLYSDLKSMAETDFPKHCKTCGRVYPDMQAYVDHTEHLRPGVSGLQQGLDEAYEPLVELYRNCACGSTLMNFFADRRDTSSAGLKRREQFQAVLEKLKRQGIEEEDAREALLRFMRGEESALLENAVRASGS